MSDTQGNPPLSKEQLDYFTEQSKIAVRRALRRYSAESLVAWLLIVAAAAFVAGGIVSTINARSFRACERLNIVRAQSNISDSVSFSILANSGIREHLLVKGDPKNAMTHQRSAEGLFRDASKLTVTALTNCHRAQDPRYNYPLAGPLGNPRTAKLGPGVQAILDSSARIVKTRHRGG